MPDGPNASGGGIRDQGPVDLTLNNDMVSNSSATADGGGISMENLASTKWMLTLNNTTVSNNHAGDAGGGVEEDGTGSVNINNSTITGNTTLNQGGGIWLDAINNGTATLNVTNTLVSGNSAGMLARRHRPGRHQHRHHHGNAPSSTTSHPVSAAASPTRTIWARWLCKTACSWTTRRAPTAAASKRGARPRPSPTARSRATPPASTAQCPLAPVAARLNTVKGSGGGIFINGGALTLSNSTVANNTATIAGGGIELQTTGAATITNTTIVGNTALNSGGMGNGGGIDSSSTTTLLNDTITNNFAVNGGGVHFSAINTLFKVQNSIVALNTVTGQGADAQGGFTDLGGNLIGISGSGSGNTGFTAGTTQTGTLANPLNPMVTGLANNGGPVAGATGNQMTVETEALLPGSPAIGKGITTNAPTTDERGFPRINTINVGAFQFQNIALKLALGTQPSLGLGANETASVTVTNTSATHSPPTIPR